MAVEYFDTTGPQRSKGDFYLPGDGYHNGDRTEEENTDIWRTEARTLDVYQMALPVVFGVIVIGGVAGNLLVIHVLATMPKLRSVTNLLLMNLAVADVLFLVTCGPLTVAHYALRVWTLGDALCRTIQYMLYVTCYVTVYTLVSIAAVRYMLVVRRPPPSCVTDPKSVVYILPAIWTVCLLVNIPVPLTYGVNTVNNVTECVISCQIKGQTFFSLFFVAGYALPLLVIGTLYFLLVRHLAAKQRGSMLSGSDASGRTNHVTCVLVLIVLVFAVCWLPLHVHLLSGSFGQLPGSFAYRMSLIVWHALVFLNSALNPLIYNLASTEFRQAFRTACLRRSAKETGVSDGSGSSKGALMEA